MALVTSRQLAWLRNLPALARQDAGRLIDRKLDHVAGRVVAADFRQFLLDRDQILVTG